MNNLKAVGRLVRHISEYAARNLVYGSINLVIRIILADTACQCFLTKTAPIWWLEIYS